MVEGGKGQRCDNQQTLARTPRKGKSYLSTKLQDGKAERIIIKFHKKYLKVWKRNIYINMRHLTKL